MAISGDGRWWFLLNVSADVRHQLGANEDLGPAHEDLRGTAIAGCILTDAELDHTSGLLQLREGCHFSIMTTSLVRRWLNDYFPVESMLSSFSDRPWTELPLDTPSHLVLADGSPTCLVVTAFETGRDVPRYVSENVADAVGSVVGLEVQDTTTGGKLVYAPGIPTIDERLQQASAGADLLLVDGTFWSDDEPQRFGITSRTSREMGHLPVSGRYGTLQWLGGLAEPRRVYIHLNNTNPILNEMSSEHADVVKRGIYVGMDGDEFEI